jgi:hypothetical protein
LFYMNISPPPPHTHSFTFRPPSEHLFTYISLLQSLIFDWLRKSECMVKPWCLRGGAFHVVIFRERGSVEDSLQRFFVRFLIYLLFIYLFVRSLNGGLPKILFALFFDFFFFAPPLKTALFKQL